MDVAAHPGPVELRVELRSEPEAAAGIAAGVGIVVVLPAIIIFISHDVRDVVNAVVSFSRQSR